MVSIRVVKMRMGCLAFHREVHLGARRAADPVLLLEEHALRPGRELLHVVEELVLVGGDAEEPLLHVPLLDRAVAAPAQSPPSACSLASTVWQDGHQFTGALAR